MSNGSLYFSHDFNATNDPKLQALVGEYGAIGYGIYWRIVEMLHSDETHALPLKKYIYLALAKQMLTSVEQVEAIIKDCINDFELIVSDGNKFWIERVMKNIESRAEISKKRSEAGKISAERRNNTTSVEQVLTSVEHDPTKEIKGKEKNILVSTTKGSKKDLKSTSKGPIETPEAFYERELIESGNDPNYRTYIDVLFGRKNGLPLKGVLSMPNQVTYKQFKELLDLCGLKNQSLSSLTMTIESKASYYKGRTSPYLVLRKWLNEK